MDDCIFFRYFLHLGAAKKDICMNKFLLLTLIPTFILAMEQQEPKLTKAPTPPERRLKGRRSDSVEFCLTPDKLLEIHPCARTLLSIKLDKNLAARAKQELEVQR